MIATQIKNSTKLGATGPEVFPIALGCMAMSGIYGKTSDDESIATIHEAIDRGTNLIDTGDFYGSGHNEMLVGRALRGRRDKVHVSVKFGGLVGPDRAFIGFDARPQLVKAFAAYSLQRLGIDVIDIYRPARLDPNVPIEETIGAIADLIKAGFVKHVGLSEVGVETIRRAHAVHPVVDVQIEYSLISRGPEQKIFPALEELGISATLYGILSRGLLSGSKSGGPGDFRGFLPRFSHEHRVQNEAVVARFSAFAKKRGQSAAQLALAWVLAKQPRLVPLVGARTRAQLLDLLAALDRPLTDEEVQSLEAIVPADAIVGSRYQAEQMARLDSEV
ncbi:MAG TPA: aldo/keto reductase [Candidatus Sulfotelmatobacter sp.]|nr:aldo/keto reductase [Candidatus Sulfotelmatobacter sp.]